MRDWLEKWVGGKGWRPENWKKGCKAQGIVTCHASSREEELRA